jgi:pimeloyl-ACP methyl ester carboxylesterase
LLFDVTALLITSAAQGPAAEAFIAPSNVAISISAGLTSSVAGDNGVPPVTITTASAVVDPGAIAHGIPISTFEIPLSNPAQIRTLSGISLVRALAALSPKQIDKIVASEPGIINKVLAAPPSATDVSALWTSLSPSARTKLVTSAPRLVGSLDGFPNSVRNTANRAWVAESIKGLKKKMSSVAGRVLAASDQHTLDMLTKVDVALKPTKRGPARTLLSVDPSGEGKAVIVLGDLQKADYVTYMVPGMFYTVDGQLSAWTGDAADLYKQQKDWLHRLAAVDPSDAHKTVAVVAWMGYQTPDLTNIGSLKLADEARDTLSRDVEAMQVLRTGNEPFTTIIAHSYGSTAALMALTQYDFSVNALVLVGTPGSAAQSAKDLHVKNTNVWVGSAAWDPVPTSAFFGSDPSAPSYGAHTMGVNGGTDVITGKALGQSLGHNEYFDSNTESIRNMALIAIDQDNLVMRDDAADAHRTLATAR